jgi:hypothetical protein
MKYETIGGAIHDTNHSLTTLRELRVGDKFRNKQGVLFEVFKPGAVSATRKCKNLETGQIESKVCRIQVTKT